MITLTPTRLEIEMGWIEEEEGLRPGLSTGMFFLWKNVLVTIVTSESARVYVFASIKLFHTRGVQKVLPVSK